MNSSKFKYNKGDIVLFEFGYNNSKKGIIKEKILVEGILSSEKIKEYKIYCKELKLPVYIAELSISRAVKSSIRRL